MYHSNQIDIDLAQTQSGDEQVLGPSMIDQKQYFKHGSHIV